MTNLTESFLRGKIAETITPTEAVPFTKDVSKVPNQTEWYITISPDTDNEEIFFYNWVTWTPGWVWTITFVTRWFSKKDWTTSVNNQKEHTINAEFKWALNHIIVNNKPDFEDLASTDNWKWASYIWVEDAWGWFTWTDLETVLAELWAWAPWVADASETVAGKVEIATTAEYDAWTDVWGTWAILVAKPSDIQNSLPVSATETVEWLVERATDAEATAWTDTTRYITSKQARDNYGQVWQVAWTSIVFSDKVSHTWTLNVFLWEPNVNTVFISWYLFRATYNSPTWSVKRKYFAWYIRVSDTPILQLNPIVNFTYDSSTNNTPSTQTNIDGTQFGINTWWGLITTLATSELDWWVSEITSFQRNWLWLDINYSIWAVSWPDDEQSWIFIWPVTIIN